MATPSTTVTYPFADLEEAKGWFNVLLSRDRPDNQNPDGTILYYYIKKEEENITLVLVKGDVPHPQQKDPLVFWSIPDDSLKEKVDKLKTIGDTSPLWEIQPVDDSEISALRYRRVRVGLISNPPISILVKS